MASKNKLYCCNCGDRGHLHKGCYKPITSYGIILIKVPNNNDLIYNLINYIENSAKNTVYGDSIRFSAKNTDNLRIFCSYVNNIKFLMIKRKHSLGYSEFMRGKYNLDNIDNIRYLFCQMMAEEIDKIKNNNFDELWKDLWSEQNIKYDKDFEKSKNKFNKLKSMNTTNINFFINNATPMYSHTEWGFPKGRRNYNESDIECAIREFQEETCYNSDDIFILNNINPITENLVGSNGVKYKHIYYLALAKSDINKEPIIDPNNKQQSSEIGGIDWLSYTEACSKIRNHHKDRLEILSSIHSYFINLISDILCT